MQQAIQGMGLEKRRVWIQWLCTHGPYWMDVRQHTGDDLLELGNGDVVTDTAIGEGAFCIMHGLSRELLSVNPSNRLRDPIAVTWRRADQLQQTVDVRNHWSLETVSQTLAALPPPFDSWRSLEEYARRVYSRLTFSGDAFDPLHGHPYAPSAAERISSLLNTLNRYCGCFDDNGERTPEGDRLYGVYFTGSKPWFTDSSDAEKNAFRLKLTFPHPEVPGEYLFCTWHGKVKTPQMRIHFSWPIAANTSLYVVYVGPKITKQ
jgi:hypothetical protein